MEMWFSVNFTPRTSSTASGSTGSFTPSRATTSSIDIFETPEFGTRADAGRQRHADRARRVHLRRDDHPCADGGPSPTCRTFWSSARATAAWCEELTRYEPHPERIDLVEMDAQVVEACRALPARTTPAVMDDRRVHIYFDNALHFIRACEEAQYDLIIVDSTDPFGPSEGLFTREFYGNCYNALRADGIMVNQQGSPFYRRGRRAPCSAATSASSAPSPSAGCIRPISLPMPRATGCSALPARNIIPIDDLDRRQVDCSCICKTQYYTTRLHVGAFYLPAFLEEMLRGGRENDAASQYRNFHRLRQQL